MALKKFLALLGPIALLLGAQIPCAADGSAGTTGNSSNSLPTLAQVTSAIEIAATSPSPNFSETIPSLSNEAPPYFVSNAQTCFLSGTFPEDPANSCSVGDLTASKSIFVFGDSQAAMWIPAFNELGQELGYKVIYVSKPSCGPNFAFETTEGPICTEFESAAIAYANSLRPSFIFPIGFERSAYGTFGDYLLIEAYEKVVSALAPSGAKVIFLSNTPHLSSDSDLFSCPLAHPTEVAMCNTTPEASLSISLRVASEQSKVAFVNLLPLFCTQAMCPLWMPFSGSDYLVYANSTHINSDFTTLIGHAFTQLIDPALTSGASVGGPNLSQPPLLLKFTQTKYKPHARATAELTGGLPGKSSLAVTGKGCSTIGLRVAAKPGSICRVTGSRRAAPPYLPISSNAVTIVFAPVTKRAR